MGRRRGWGLSERRVKIASGEMGLERATDEGNSSQREVGRSVQAGMGMEAPR
jgi:hypothetical protein